MSCWRVTTRCLCGLAFSLFPSCCMITFPHWMLASLFNSLFFFTIFSFFISIRGTKGWWSWANRRHMEFELCPLRPCKSHQLQLLCHTAVDGKTATVNVNKKLLELLFLLPTYKRTDYIYGTVRHIGSLTDLFRKKRKPHV